MAPGDAQMTYPQRMTESVPPVVGGKAAPSPKELAAHYGLAQSGARPTFFTYVRQLWGRRHFIVEYARARNQAQYTDTALGQVWQILTPVLNAAVFYLIFGILLNTSRGVTNYISFLVVGVFIFTYTQRAVLSGSRSIAGNLGLVRALHFPRATLPLASTVMELQQLLVSVVVLCGIVLATGEPLTRSWLLLVPALALQTLFNCGLALIFARITSRVRDMEQLLPFALRTWMYASGVFFVIATFAATAPVAVKIVLEGNPAAVYIECVRGALMASHPAPLYVWPLAVAWALGTFVVGFVYFWRAEERYGRG
jgi:teichoic acid transport system permease protein